ncbi:MAG: hypothetical protein H7240_00455 [Glaciimonas sp.]|nr:hypothetical protein [Glaciimonas sp.]
MGSGAIPKGLNAATAQHAVALPDASGSHTGNPYYKNNRPFDADSSQKSQRLSLCSPGARRA